VEFEEYVDFVCWVERGGVRCECVYWEAKTGNRACRDEDGFELKNLARGGWGGLKCIFSMLAMDGNVLL